MAGGLAFIAIGVLAAVVGEAQGAKVNLALGRPYEYYPTPKYHYCTDAGDTEQLTDGKTNYRSGQI